MILRGGLKPEVFVSAIACTIGADHHYRVDAESCEQDEIYLAGGYWRALTVWSDSGNMLGVRLVNPDRTQDEILAAERGIAILRHLEFHNQFTNS